MQQWRISMHPCWRVFGKNLNIVSMCAVPPLLHTSNMSSCQKKKKKTFSLFLWLWTIPFGFLVINVCNHGEHYEPPCISRFHPSLWAEIEEVRTSVSCSWSQGCVRTEVTRLFLTDSTVLFSRQETTCFLSLRDRDTTSGVCVCEWERVLRYNSKAL